MLFCNFCEIRASILENRRNWKDWRKTLSETYVSTIDKIS